MSQSMEGNEWGAVDLSSMAGQTPEPTQPLATPDHSQTGPPLASSGTQTAGPGQVPSAAQPPGAPASPTAGTAPIGGEATSYVTAPLIVDVTEQTFEQQMALSATVQIGRAHV